MQGQSVINVTLKTPLEIRLGIGIYETSLLHRPDDYIGFTPSCPPTFYNKIAPMIAINGNSCYFTVKFFFSQVEVVSCSYIADMLLCVLC